MKFLKSKRFWLTLLALIVIGLLIYFIFLKKDIVENGIAPLNGQGEEKKDKTEPASQIKSPIANSWHSKSFVIDVLDEDLESGIDYNSCEYKILTYDDDKEYSTGWLKRKCNSSFSVSVGEKKMCGFEGKNACWLYVRSKDKDNNQHNPNLENKSVVYLNIDWNNPVAGKVFITNTQQEQIYPINIEEKKQYNFKTNISDNFKITGCNLYINNQDQGTMSALIPGCEKECMFSKEFIPEQAGFYQIFTACRDAAGNISKSETIEAKTNLAPEIISCRANPASGSLNTEFSFFVEVLNPDNDPLSFYWDFNDGEFSEIENPTHFYKNPGTYKPSILVSDNQGAADSCSTAWISILQD